MAREQILNYCLADTINILTGKTGSVAYVDFRAFLFGVRLIKEKLWFTFVLSINLVRQLESRKQAVGGNDVYNHYTQCPLRTQLESQCSVLKTYTNTRLIYHLQACADNCRGCSFTILPNALQQQHHDFIFLLVASMLSEDICSHYKLTLAKTILNACLMIDYIAILMNKKLFDLMAVPFICISSLVLFNTLFVFST